MINVTWLTAFLSRPSFRWIVCLVRAGSWNEVTWLAIISNGAWERFGVLNPMKWVVRKRFVRCRPWVRQSYKACINRQTKLWFRQYKTKSFIAAKRASLKPRLHEQFLFDNFLWQIQLLVVMIQQIFFCFSLKLAFKSCDNTHGKWQRIWCSKSYMSHNIYVTSRIHKQIIIIVITIFPCRIKISLSTNGYGFFTRMDLPDV